MKTIQKQSIAEIYEPIQKDLDQFQTALKKELASDDSLIQSIHEHLLKMTGKFLRPSLTLLCASLKNRNNIDKAVKLAVVMELLHTATLVHDDIIDNSELRRNQPSIFFKWGKEISIVSGDYLYAKAFVLLADLKDVWLNQALALCAHVMCEGEMKQIEKRQDFLMSEEQYMKIIHKKTAALFQAACMGGAYFTGLGKADIEKLGSYGYNLGMAFQIVDDCLDLIGDTESLGKTVGLDIYKNDVTLPILYLFHSLGQPEKEKLLHSFENAQPGLFETIKAMAVESKSLEKSMNTAKKFVNKALTDIQGISASTYKDSLTALANHCTERIR